MAAGALRYCQVSPCGEHSHVNPLPFAHSVINIVAATVCFLMLLLSPVNCSYLNPCSLCFIALILLSNPQGRKGKDGRGSGLECIARNTEFGNTIP